GKYILRVAFENMLPAEIVWREKVPIEGGTGTAMLPKIFEQKISPSEFDRLKERYLLEDGVAIRSKEQLFYYQIYRELFGPPHPDGSTKKICPMCHSNVPDDMNYCRICGAYPI
ncbi:MAG: asparagine synthase, partial [Thaumarchaeota archaeon]